VVVEADQLAACSAIIASARLISENFRFAAAATTRALRECEFSCMLVHKSS
jgi:hypothetical protein